MENGRPHLIAIAIRVRKKESFMKTYFRELRKTARAVFPIAATGLALAAFPIASHAQTATIVGYPANFDAVNTTGQVTHGFEIEADGIQSSDINRIFGSPGPGLPCYIRYCAGVATNFPGGVYIRWESPWDPNAQQFTQGTPIPNGTYIGGESCWTFGLGANYPAAGCDHFGISSLKTPTQVTYRWLVADPNNPGQLIPFSLPGAAGAPPIPAPVQIPQPVINVIPPAQPAGQPVVDFMIQVPPPPPPPPFVPPQFGDAQWVKVYKNESPAEVDLNNLLQGDPAVPVDAQVETEWKLLQTNPNSPNSGVLHNQAVLGNGSHAVIRRYAHYKYSGSYEALTHEAVCGGDGSCTAPLPGELGDIIGEQMAAANLEIPSVTVAKTGNGTVSGDGGKINCGGACTVSVVAGTVVGLTANPAGDAVFGGWTGDCTGSNPSCSLTVNKSLSTTAAFTPVFTLSVGHAGNGTVAGTPTGAFNTSIACGGNCSAKFPVNTAVTLTATPTAPAKFVNWTGACSGSAPVCTVAITADTKVQANFK
jgi:hypothetical protein